MPTSPMHERESSLAQSLSRGSLKVLVPTSPAAAARTTYPPGTLLQSPESLHEAAVRASFSLGGPGCVEEGLEEEEEFVDASEG